MNLKKLDAFRSESVQLALTSDCGPWYQVGYEKGDANGRNEKNSDFFL